MNQHTQNLIATLKQLPSDWPLVPTKYKKPLGYFWQTRPFTPGQLSQGLISNSVTVLDQNQQPYLVMPTGFGLLTGYPIKGGDKTYYLMALDQDGTSAHQKILELSQGVGLPHTIAFTSGRRGRCQYLFAVRAEDISQLKTRKISTGKDEALELRWKGCQSILPPSLHPLSGQYQWCEGCSISTNSVAIAPDWLLKLMRLPGETACQPKFKLTKTNRNLGKCHQQRRQLKYQVRPSNSRRL